MKKFGIGVAIIVLIIGFVSIFIGMNFNDKEYEVTVTRVERVVDKDFGGDIDGKYLVYCEDKSGKIIVFENTDNLIRGKVNSSDIYARIKEGNKYVFTVVGFRIPLFSMYQNIIEVRNP